LDLTRGNGDVQEFWKRIKKHIRTFGKGWDNNVRGQLRRDKQSLMEELKRVDAKAETDTLSSAQWRDRYGKERALEQIYAFKEIQWKKRGGERWLLQEDANTGYFHNKANGRKKKCTIFSLEDEDKIVTGEQALRAHIEEYYKKLFGAEEEMRITVEEDFWTNQETLSDEEANELIQPFYSGRN
jgi:hypothetical protein